VPDTSVDPDFTHGANDFDVDIPPPISELAVPVKIGTRVVAVINVEHLSPSAFSTQHQNLLEIIAGHVSSAMERVHRITERKEN